ncbi:type IV secretion protein Rhs, partial [Streptomyces varsoviensis]
PPAKSKIDAATKLAPEKPEFHDRMAGDALDGFEGGQVELLHFAGGVVRSGTDVLKFARGLNPTDPYNITHPAAYLDNVSNTAAGILSLASHPERLPGALLGTGWGSDPSEAGGRLFGNIIMAIGTGGAGTAAKATEGAVLNATKKVAQEGAETGVKQAGKSAARREAERGPHEGTRPDGTKTTKGTDPVDLASGRMFLPQVDVVLPGTLPLTFARKAQSGYRAGRWLGPSWSSTLDQRLEIDAEGVVFVGEDGMVLTYPHPAPGVPTLPVEGPRWPLEIPGDGGYAIRDPDVGRVWHFGSCGGGAAEGSYDSRAYGNGAVPGPYGDNGTVSRPHAENGIAPLEQISDRDGHWIAFERDADGVPTAIVHDSGYRVRVTTEVLDRAAVGATDSVTGGGLRVTALHLAGGGPEGADVELVRYGYTGGDLTEVVNSSGLPLRFEYDERGRITAWTDRNESRYEYTYDAWDRCVFESGAEGHMRATLEYGPRDPDTGLSVTTLTNSLGHTSRYVINRALQVVTEIDPTGAAVHSRWDRYDRLCARTDALGRTTEYRRDEAGRLIALVRPDGRAATASYDELGKPVTITEPDGATWHQTFDGAGRRTSVTDPAGATTRYTYDELGHPASVTDASGATTRIRCDAAGLPVEITDPLGGTTSYRRDAFGRITAVIDPVGATTRLAWSVEGKLVRRVEADGSEQSWTYDGEGNCTAHTDALGGVTRSEYTHFDQLSARTGPDGVRHEFRHNTQLQLQEVINPQGLAWSYAYDPAGRLLSETDFDGRTLTYTHDAAGRLTSRTDALGQTIGYEHDVLDRLVAKDVAGEVTRYRHDAAGRLVEADGPDATLVFGRDRLGRVKSQTCDGRTLTFAYDELGRRTRRVTPSGAVSTWSYDAAGRRTSVSASGHVFALEHDAAGREVARHFGESLSLTMTQAWDPAGRLTTQTLRPTDGSAAPLQSRAYTYRRDGNLTGVDDLLSGPRTYGLDVTGRVTSVDAADWTERYAYDATGNQSEAHWPADHPGAEARGARAYTGTRVTRAGGVRYEYDALGRVVLRQKTRLSRKPDTWRYEWDPEDRLTSVTTPDGTRWRYRYDPLGRRTTKQRLTDTGEVAEQTDFTWDGPTLTEQTTTTAAHPNAVTLTWDHNGLQPIAQTERITAAEAPQREIDQRFFAIITDLIGTPSELIAESGEISWRKRSTLWGSTTWPVTSTAYTPLRFPGQYFDPETGLHYNYHRHYDPETARYTTPDPLGLAPAPNPVAYVHNPHTWADPLGLSPCPTDDLERRTEPAHGTGAGNEHATSVTKLGRSDNSTVITGHGYYVRGTGDFQVPGGTWIKFYTEDGLRLKDSIGLKVETGGKVQPVETFGPGSSVPNYTVGPPADLNISSRSISVSQPTLLSDIIQPNMGATHATICREHISPR